MRTLGEPLLSPGAGEQQWAAGLSDSGDDDTVMSRVMFFLDLAKHARRPTWGSLSTYRFYHSHLYRKFFYVVVLAQLLLPVWQPASRNDPTRVNGEHWQQVMPAETLIVLLLMFDIRIQVKVKGAAAFKRSVWAIIKISIVTGMAINLMVNATLDWPFYFMRPFYSFLLVERTKNVRRILENAVLALPRVMFVAVPLLLFLLFAAALAFVMFRGVDSDCVCKKLAGPAAAAVVSGEGLQCSYAKQYSGWDESAFDTCSVFSANCRDFFKTLGSSIVHLFHMVQTVNNPDVTLPSFACNPWSQAFFQFFLLVGFYFLMSLILAIVFSSFQELHAKKAARMANRRVFALDAAFRMLTVCVCGRQQKGRDSARSEVDGEGGDYESGSSADANVHEPILNDSGKSSGGKGSTTNGIGDESGGGGGGGNGASNRLTRHLSVMQIDTFSVNSETDADSTADVGESDRPATRTFSGIRVDGSDDASSWIARRLARTQQQLRTQRWFGADGFGVVNDAPQYCSHCRPKLSLQGFVAMCHRLFPTVPPQHCDTLFGALYDVVRQPSVSGGAGAVLAEVPRDETDLGIGRLQFQQLLPFLRTRFEPVDEETGSMHGPPASVLAEEIGDGNSNTGRNAWLRRQRRKARAIVFTRTFRLAADTLVLLSSALIYYRLTQLPAGACNIDSGCTTGTFSLESTDTWNVVFTVILALFVVELVLNLLAWEPVQFWQARWVHKLDVVVVTSAILCYVVAAAGVDASQSLLIYAVVLLLRVLRALRPLANSRKYATFARTVSQIIPGIMLYFVAVLVMWYSFAVIGMELFAGRVTHCRRLDPNVTGGVVPCADGALEPRGAPCVCAGEEDIFGSHAALFCLNQSSLVDNDDSVSIAQLSCNPLVQQSAFATANYWYMHFNTLPNAMVVLFQLTVVNNWPIIEEGHLKATSSWHRVYFIAFWLVMVVVLFNLLTSFMLEAFSATFARNTVRQDDWKSAHERKLELVLRRRGVGGLRALGIRARDEMTSSAVLLVDSEAAYDDHHVRSLAWVQYYEREREQDVGL